MTPTNRPDGFRIGGMDSDYAELLLDAGGEYLDESRGLATAGTDSWVGLVYESAASADVVARICEVRGWPAVTDQFWGGVMVRVQARNLPRVIDEVVAQYPPDSLAWRPQDVLPD